MDSDVYKAIESVYCKIKDSSEFIYRNKLFMRVFFLISILNFSFTFSFSIFTPMVLDALNPKVLGMINSIGCVGQIVGSLLLRNIRIKKDLVSFLMKVVMISGLLGPFIIGLSSSAFLWGVGFTSTLGSLAIINALNHTFWQSNSPESLQGTIFGIRRMATSAIAPFGALLSGPTADYLKFSEGGELVNGYQLVFLSSGIFIFLIGMVGLKFCKGENKYEEIKYAVY